jgi:hypothetical protein
MKTFKITSLHRVQSVRTCSEYTNTWRDKEIREVTAPDRSFQVISPFNLHSLLRNYLKLFGEDSSQSQNASKLLTEKFPKYSKPRSFRGWGNFSPRGPYQGCSAPLETLSGPQTPRRLSSPLTQNPRSAPEYCYYFPSSFYSKV